MPFINIGYNIFSNIKYARVSQNIYASDEFIVIRDFHGNYGVRDRFNIIVPVNYSEITSAECYNLDNNVTISRDLLSYNFDLTLTNWEPLNYCRIMRRHIHNETQTPNIRFYLKNKEGNKVIWDCNQHLNSLNLCTSIINVSAETIFDENISGAFDYFNSLAEVNENNPELAKKIILKCFKKYLSQEYQFNSLQELNELLESQRTLTHNTANNLRLAMNRSYQLS